MRARLTTPPRVFDPQAAERAWSDVVAAAPAAQPLADEPATRALIDGVLGCAPYLSSLAQRHAGDLVAMFAAPPEEFAATLIEEARAAGREAPDEAALMTALRRAKTRLHLLLALADLGGALDVNAVTAALSDFADASVEAALAGLVRAEQARGKLPVFEDETAGPLPGYFVLAMGKHGGRELNYSSDIDLVVFFDEARLEALGVEDVRRACVRVTQGIVRILQEPTVDGYVWRVDLRLRPDAGATAPAIATEAALRYYESLGQSWERAALIKARACAGDARAAGAFLGEISPFIWRRSLDYAAIADIHGLMRQVRAGVKSEGRGPAGYDVKRGAGGIREIEFFAQCQQLLFGGRKPALRARRTEEALTALADAGFVERADADALITLYREHRALEHRLQMLNDEQTHRIPAAPDKRARLAAFCGADNLEAFDANLVERFGRVGEICGRAFAPLAEAGKPAAADDIVFTGVEDDPATVAALSRHGFKDPEKVIDAIRGWRAGRVAAARSERARALLVRLAPMLVEAAGETGSPDYAFLRFREFYERLPAGVQLMTLFVSEPQLLRTVVEILALAPRLGPELARQPAALDVMLEPDFFESLEAKTGAVLAARAKKAVAEAADFESAINAARRVGREEFLRIGTHVLLGRTDADGAGRAYAALADALIAALAHAAEAEVARRHGRVRGDWCVLGLGKLGGGEMTANSDLDLMVVYYAGSDATSDGARPLTAEAYYARVTQRLIAALSAPTEEGPLYEVDMALRPSGKAGPIAVRLSAFDRYYAEDAWTWELMALTRARVITGPKDLADAVANVREATLTKRRPRAKIVADVKEMRERIAREKPAQGDWDLKFAPGGLVDVEFATQLCELLTAPKRYDVVHPSTRVAIARLAEAGALDAADAASLSEAATLGLDLTQLLRLVADDAFDPATAPERLLELLARAGGAKDFKALEKKLAGVRTRARAVFDKLLR